MKGAALEKDPLDREVHEPERGMAGERFALNLREVTGRGRPTPSKQKNSSTGC